MNTKVEDVIEGYQNDSVASLSDRIKLSQYEDLIKKLLYACEKCDGALIQLATCTSCKKTAMRICIRCNTVLRIPHRSCGIIGDAKCLADSALGAKMQ